MRVGERYGSPSLAVDVLQLLAGVLT